MIPFSTRLYRSPLEAFGDLKMSGGDLLEGADVHLPT